MFMMNPWQNAREHMSDTVKLVVFAPTTHADGVREAMGNGGAGTLGPYSHCTFSIPGTGRFVPQEGADPHDGTIGELNAVREERIETDCPRDILSKVINAVKSAHPYEEVPIDIYPLEQAPQ